MTVDEKTVGIWFVPLKDSDYMAHVSRGAEPGHFKLEWRFRYYSPASKNPFDEKDRKSWYRGESKSETEESVIAKMRGVASILALSAGERPHEILMKDCGSVENFMKTLTRQPWAHAQRHTLQ